MQIYYMNDENKDMLVRVMDSRYDPATATGDIYVKLKPSEGYLFDLHLPEGQVPWVKKWENMVLISGIDVAALPLSSQAQQQQEDA